MHPLIIEYLDKRTKERNWSVIHRRNNAHVLRNMETYLEKDIKEMTFEDLNSFLKYKVETQEWYTFSTIKNAITVMKQFFKYLVTNKIIEKSPAEPIEYPSLKKTTDGIVDKEYRGQKKVIDSPYITDRQRALWYLTTSYPFSAKEITNIKRSDVKLEYGKINFRDRGTTIPIFLTEKAIKAIKRYLITFNPQGEYLFPSKKGEQVTNSLIWRELLKVGKLADPGKKLGKYFQGVRVVRRGDIVRYLDSGADMYTILYKLGYKSFSIFDSYIPKTTRRRIKLGKAHRQYENYMKKRGFL